MFPIQNIDNFLHFSSVADQIIFLDMKQRPVSYSTRHSVDECYEDVIDPILGQKAVDSHSFPRTIMHLPLKWCGYVHDSARSICGTTSKYIYDVMAFLEKTNNERASINITTGNKQFCFAQKKFHSN